MPATESPTDPKPRLLLLAGVLVLLLIVGAAAYGGWRVLAHDEPNPYPSAWDAKVEPFVKIVEKERGLTFEHPIHVDFLTFKDFKDQIASERKEDLFPEDKEEIEHSAGLLRAVGLLDGDVDLFDSQSELTEGGTIGFYSYDDERIRVRGKKLTPAVQSTLIHELTHALQDQHFDLGTRFKVLDKSDDSSAVTGYQAIVEGDASRIETQWAKSLSKKKRAALERSKAAQTKEARADIGDVPEILQTFMGAPYALGEAMISLAVKEDGDAAANQLFAKPPTTDEHLLDPWTLIADEEPALGVGPPKLEKGEEKFDEGTFGEATWLFMLAERLPPLRAIDAADGWGGDAYVAFERDGVSCVRINYQGDTKRDTAEMASGLKDWMASLPDTAANVRQDHRVLVFESCDPGRKASRGPELVGRGARPRAHPDLPVFGPRRPGGRRVLPVRVGPPDPQLLGRGAGPDRRARRGHDRSGRGGRRALPLICHDGGDGIAPDRPAPRARQGPGRRAVRRATHGRRPGPVGRTVAGALQPRVPSRIR